MGVIPSPATHRPKYLKRFRMEIDFRGTHLPQPELPREYRWAEWNGFLLREHAKAKFQSFHAEMDSQIFPSLRTHSGCRELMQSITDHRGFLPSTTWLVQLAGNEFRPSQPCGTIQGLLQSDHMGAIQNIGVVPDHRGCGIGRALLLKCLHGFRAHGLHRVYLDVSAENVSAIGLYRSVGFEHVKTSYREIVLPLENVNS